MSNVKNQHYVPRFYLRGFANNKKQVWAFDKTTSKSFPSSLGNLASENYFYDQKILDEALGSNFIEKSLEEIEGKIAPLLTKLLDDLDNRRVFAIDEETKAQLCEYVSIQIIRTKEYRQSISQIIDIIGRDLAKKYSLTEEQTKDMGFDPDPEVAKRYQIAQLMPRESLRQELSKALGSHICLLYKNATAMPFYTSDHPVARRAHIPIPDRSFLGWASWGIEIAFPLSSKYMLLLYERSHFQEFEQVENQVLVLTDPQNIIYYNSLQIRGSYRFVYCCNPDFGLAEKMVATHQDLRNPNRQRSGLA